ncbi:MAG: hypothetical protein F4X57_14250 [Chloroflexi bacterium]|nr:hypothetical protein [Chloroflexota bacterium]
MVKFVVALSLLSFYTYLIKSFTEEEYLIICQNCQTWEQYYAALAIEARNGEPETITGIDSLLFLMNSSIIWMISVAVFFAIAMLLAIRFWFWRKT